MALFSRPGFAPLAPTNLRNLSPLISLPSRSRLRATSGSLHIHLLSCDDSITGPQNSTLIRINVPSLSRFKYEAISVSIDGLGSIPYNQRDTCAVRSLMDADCQRPLGYICRSTYLYLGLPSYTLESRLCIALVAISNTALLTIQVPSQRIGASPSFRLSALHTATALHGTRKIPIIRCRKHNPLQR